MMRTRIATTLLTSLMIFISFAGVARAACAHPDSDALIDGELIGFVKTLTTPVGPHSANLRWVTVSGTSMMYGGVFVVDCHGAKLADAGLGFVERQRRGPIVDGEPTLVANYHTASGTGIDIQSVAVLQYRKGAIIKLWDHPSFDGEYPPYPALGQQTETTYRWRFLAGGRKIEVMRRDVVLLGRHEKHFHHPMAEHFCLNSRTWKYLPCR